MKKEDVNYRITRNCDNCKYWKPEILENGNRRKTCSLLDPEDNGVYSDYVCDSHKFERE